MNMRRINNLVTVATFALVTALVPQAALALGADHHNKKEVTSDAWPKGMSALVNLPERIHGYFVNAADVFFFTGNQKLFNEVLLKYSEIDGVVEHKIVIHEGRGRAKSPWQKNEGLPCDWMIYGCPASWASLASKAKGDTPEGYMLESHIGKEGAIKIDRDRLPKKIAIEVVKAEQDGADQPATAPKTKGNQNSEPESKGRSR